MDKKEKLQMLRKLIEADLTKKFLIPLFESDGMACKGVRYTHTTLEFGKDIVYYKDDEYGNRVYTGIQVKKTKITARNIADILRQTTEAFGEPFTDLSDGKKKDLDRFVVLTSNEFSESANKSFRASLRGAKLDKLVTCIDGNQLVGLLERHMPSAFWDEYDYFNRYSNAMKKDFTTIKDISAIGQKEPVSLEEIYVSLRLSEERAERALPAEEEWKIFAEKAGIKEREEIEKRVERARILDSERAVKDYDRLVIVGDPGSGKTTLLKYLAIKSCRENLEKQERTCVPIPITLRQLAESGKSLRAYIDKVFEKYEFPKAKKLVEKDLKEGRCMLLLDGFDELATKESQEKITGEIQKFARKYHKSRLVVTSRPAGYHDELKGFTKVEVLEFDDTQIKKFIENWFGVSEQGKAKSMFGAIKRNDRIKALARNPLMIAIIAIIYEEDRKLPQRRADLYKRCVEVLLSKWDVQKRLKNKYPSETKKFILRKLAFYGHTNNKRVMTKEEVFVEMLKHFPQVGLAENDAGPFLDEIWQRSYLLKQISRTSYDFLHLSFQEYFTALELKEREDGLSTIIEHLDEPWWEEPILLYAGINRDASALIKAIGEKVPEDMFCSNLMLFGMCVADAEFTELSPRDEVVSQLWSLYENGEFRPLREKTITVLGLIKPDGLIDSLIADLNDESVSVRGHAANALGRIGSEKAIEILVGTLRTDKDSFVRCSAADALRRICSEKSVEPLLYTFMTDKNRDVMSQTAEALSRIASKKTIEPLLKVLKTDKSRAVRWRSAYVLGSIGSEKTIEPLHKILTTNKDHYVRWYSADALGRIGSEKAIELLINILTTDKDSSMRSSAAYALRSVCSDKAIKPLVCALTTDKDGDVRGYATYAFGNIERIGSKKAVELLTKVFTTDKDRFVQGSAAYALGLIGSEKAIELLLKALRSDKGISMQWNVISALGRIGSEKSIDPLLVVLKTAKEGFIRGEAAEALGRIGSKKAIEPLVDALTTDKDSSVRGSAAEALGRIGSEKAIGPLKQALGDEGEYVAEKVKDAAFAALEKISRRNSIRITRR